MSLLFHLLLLFVNSIGIVGAFLEILGIQWYNGAGYDISGSRAVLDGRLFWAGLFLLCGAAILVWQEDNRKRRVLCVGAGVLVYVVLLLAFRQELRGGLLLLSEDAVKTLNVRYQFHIAWADGAQLLAEANAGNRVRVMTLSVLACCVPLELLFGLSWNHGRCFCLIVGNGLWFTAACACNVFPGFFFLSFCVLGLLAVFVQKDFEGQAGAGIGAVAWVVVLAGLVMGAVYRFLLPVLDVQYEDVEENRTKFYQMVNEEWLPGLQSIFSGYGIVGGVDVTGELYRKNVFSYTSKSAYRVTVGERPQGTVYLKAYVGGAYGKREWGTQSDAFFEKYYQKNGLDLPKSYNSLANLCYEAVKTGRWGEAADSIQIEELGGKGSYSIYPYGALLSEDYKVRSDGSAVRKDKEYGFSYYALTGGTMAKVPGELEKLEQQYRQYVYDTFLEYPAEQLPQLTESLEEENIRTDNVYLCAADIMEFLDRQADYDLDAERNPSGTDFVEYFLFDSHEGYCVHFASAAVLAFRYCGIPARYVTGYAASASSFIKNPKGGYTAELTGQHAHAWAEIYLDAIGWVPVEMTPGAVAFPRDNRMELLAQLGQLEGQEILQAGNFNGEGLQDIAQSGLGEQTGQELSGQDTELQFSEASPEPLDSEMEDEDEEEEDVTATDEYTVFSGNQDRGGGNYGRLPAALAATLLLFTGGGICLWKIRVRHWRRALGEARANRKISLLYKNMRKALHIAGCPEQLNVVGEPFWQALRKVYPQMGKKEYEDLCVILEKNTFGRREPSAEEARTVCLIHDGLVEELYEKTPFYKKPYYKWRCCYGG